MSAVTGGGAAWSRLQLPEPFWVTDLAADRQGRLCCFVADEPFGSVLACLAREDGRWTPQELPGGSPLRSLCTLEDGTLVAVGGEGDCVLRQEGGWARLPRAGFDVRRVSGPSPGLIFAVGSDRVALFDGGRWRAFRAPPGPISLGELELADVTVLAGGAGWAVGRDGSHSAILRLEGGRLSSDEGCESFDLHRVRALSPEVVVAAGDGGVYRRPWPAAREGEEIVWQRVTVEERSSGFFATDVVGMPDGPLVAGFGFLGPGPALLWSTAGWQPVGPPADGRVSSVRVLAGGLLGVGTRGAVWTAPLAALLGR